MACPSALISIPNAEAGRPPGMTASGALGKMLIALLVGLLAIFAAPAAVAHSGPFTARHATPTTTTRSITSYDAASKHSSPTVISDPVSSAVPSASDGTGTRVAARLILNFVAADTAGGGARFITNAAGDTLDTSRVTIPEGKFGYLLKDPSKAGVFSDSMGFDQS